MSLSLRAARLARCGGRVLTPGMLSMRERIMPSAEACGPRVPEACLYVRRRQAPGVGETHACCVRAQACLFRHKREVRRLLRGGEALR